MCIAIACFPLCDIIVFQIDINFLIKSISHMSGQKFEYLMNEKNFLSEIKAVFIIF